ncbi:hypothetical protein BV898_18642 [Hypsibius exemplaris]|uniref:DNA mismatch repair protein S5 domain-containing protein n=1 Tax=Hypsibius exemplaris TaxID=2072580 RepID=A0A9X6RP16_HYPEX|nr:hypothetical protein BV898_18642 [Hypsibius exemplaris]
MTAPDADLLEEYNVSQENRSSVYTIAGWISDCEHGSSRNNNERQFIFINRRPSEYPKISKLIAAVYREFNRKTIRSTL